MADVVLRSDAERNRLRILAAAADVIARDGVDATVEEIARAAGVGMGTLYRRFSTKDVLVDAVLTDLSEGALADVALAAAEPDAWQALERTLRALARRIAESRGLLDALEVEQHSGRLLEVRARLLDALDPLLARAQEAGVARADVTSTEVLRLTALVTKLPPLIRAAEPDAWERLLDVVLDGLRA